MNKNKFTLIEVLVAMTVFVIGIAPLLGVLTSVTMDHIEFKNKGKAEVFLKYKAREIIDSNVGASAENTSGSGSHDEEIRNVRYAIYVEDVFEGTQKIRMIAGTSANLISEPFDIDDEEDEPLIEARLYFTHTYPIY